MLFVPFSTKFVHKSTRSGTRFEQRNAVIFQLSPGSRVIEPLPRQFSSCYNLKNTMFQIDHVGIAWYCSLNLTIPPAIPKLNIMGWVKVKPTILTNHGGKCAGNTQKNTVVDVSRAYDVRICRTWIAFPNQRYFPRKPFTSRNSSPPSPGGTSQDWVGFYSKLYFRVV